MDVVINSDINTEFEGGLPIVNQGDYYHNLLTCLGYPIDAPPVADLLRRYHGLDGDWLIASPIYWQATHNDAMIMASGSELQLSDQESQRWFSVLDEFVRADKTKLHYHDANTWLIQVDEHPEITAKPVHRLLHQSMTDQLKALDPTLFWQRFITENQMMFSQHSLNNSRMDTNPINGLWVWGGGHLNSQLQRLLVCDDEQTFKLAGLLSTQVRYLQPGKKLDKHAVILSTPDQVARLKIQLQKNTVRWYWNNKAYLTQPQNRWSRLWRTVKSCL